jgi:hypothetical protein
MKSIRRWLLILGIPVTYMLILRLVFDLDLFRNFAAVMSLTFIFAIPFGSGYLVIVFSSIENVRSRSYRIFMPWIPVLVLLMITMAFGIEGWACWLMILPAFLLLSSLGGSVAGYYKMKRHDRSQKTQISLVILLPFLVAPLEKMIPARTKLFEARTAIEIRAARENIWNNVIRVREIAEKEDRGTLTNFLGFPRPVRAELNYAGVGGTRQAIFSKGLVFEEVVREYEDQKRMVFSIKADPRAIPATTMDKHVVIGGEYFDVLDGTYELERLSDGFYRLHLYSHFTMKTDFNFYAGWWAKWIMKDIQNNILQVIQTRCALRL